MRKKIIISLVCLLSFLGITAYCFVNRKTDGSEQVTEVSKQEVKTVKKAVKSEEKKDADGNKTNAVSKQTSTKTESSKASTTSKDKTSSQNKTKTASQDSNNKSEKKALDNTSTNQSNTSISKQEVVKEAEKTKTQEVVQQPVIESTPVPVEPSYACPGGVDQNQACDVILDSNFYYAIFSSESEANSSGEYYLNDVMYIGETEITNYSVQPVYRNDHSIAYYGLNLWSNGSLID